MIPLSFAQRRLWFIDRFKGPSALYNVPFVIWLNGELDTGALESAVRDVIVRHESLRTVFIAGGNGTPAQRVVPASELALTVPVHEVPPGELAGALARAVAYRFDLSAEIPVQACLLRCGPAEHALVLVIHHIAADGESALPLARDLAAAYAARSQSREPEWAELPVQYSDYALWQRELLGEEDDAGSALSTQLRESDVLLIP